MGCRRARGRCVEEREGGRRVSEGQIGESARVVSKARAEEECARARRPTHEEREMAEEGMPPLAADWSVEQVAAWVLTLEGIDDLEAVAAKVRAEEVDGFT